MNAGYGSPDGDSLLWSSDNPAAPGAATHQGMVYGIQHPFTGKIFYPPTSRCWGVGQPGLFQLMSEWAPYELREIDDAEQRAQVCGIEPSEVKPGVKAIMLAVPLDEARAIAQARYDKGAWPEFYFTNGGKGGLRRKRYLDQLQGRVVDNLWLHEEVGHTDEAKKGLKKLFDGSAPFDTPKPVRLLDRILTIASDKDSLVVDFFSGSATTAEAVMRKNTEDGGNRRFVLVQLPEEISGSWGNLCNVGEERIRRAGAKIAAEVEQANEQLELGAEPKPVPDIGFRVMRVDDSCLKDEYAAPGEYTQDSLDLFADNTVEGASPLDLLFQVLPAFRIEYSAKIVERELGGKACFDVNDGQLIACFDKGVDTEALEAIAREKPLYAVFRDSCFSNDAAVANLEELFKTFSPDTIKKVI